MPSFAEADAPISQIPASQFPDRPWVIFREFERPYDAARAVEKCSSVVFMSFLEPMDARA